MLILPITPAAVGPKSSLLPQSVGEIVLTCAGAADIYCSRICELNPDAVLIQGEMSLTYALIHRLRQSGIHVLCAASERVCTTAAADDGSVIRKSIFKFVRFREYF